MSFDTVKARAKRYYKTNFDSAEYYYKLQDSLAQKLGHKNRMLDARIFLSTYYDMTQRYEEGRALLEEIWDMDMDTIYRVELGNAYANGLAQVDKIKADSIYRMTIPFAEDFSGPLTNRPSLFANYALFLVNRGRPYNAAIYFEKALKEPFSDYQKYMTLGSLCTLFASVENWSRMEEYMLQTIELAEQKGYKGRNGNTALNYANLLIKKGNLPKAREELSKAQKFTAMVKKDDFYNNLIQTSSKYYTATNQWDSLRLVLEDPKFEKYRNGAAFQTAQIKYWMGIQDYEKTLQSARQMYEIGQKAHSPKNVLLSHRAHALAYEKLGQKSVAFDYLKKAKTLSDSLSFETQNQEINYLEARYKRSEQDQMIELLDEKNRVQSKVVSQQRKILIGGGISLLLISLLTFFLWRLFRIVNGQKEAIKKALSQKDILLREIHHRVKNNLQLVSSLLTLQSRSISDETALEALNEGKARVRSMALIHQDLYNKENITSISAKDYIEKLTNELFQTYKVTSDKIALTLNIQNIDLDVDTLVPLGLIINELITNSLKYAFKNRDSGKLTIELKEQMNHLILSIGDDGIGYDKEAKESTSFGTTLVNALTKQLDGKIERFKDNGTQIKMTFSDYKTSKN